MKHTKSLGLLALVFALGCSSAAPTTPEPQGSSFPSADQAAQGLVTALRWHDAKRLSEILGPEGDELVSSGDDVEDKHRIDEFLKMYDEKHDLVARNDASYSLEVGQSQWPFPIPIVKLNSGWVFDTRAGKDEILDRRIGRNESNAIEVCLAIVDAQREYALLNPCGHTCREYARRFLSEPGKKNGLYWDTAEGEAESPLGPLIGAATEEGYNLSPESRIYKGYCFKMLKAQSENAAGGAFDYVVDEHMIGGFAVVAYPAEYANSGVMTFIASHEGVVYQCDLGPDTEAVVGKMAAFDPSKGWEKCPASGESGATPR